MKLAIADPPYLGRAACHYGLDAVVDWHSGPVARARGHAYGRASTSLHAEAAIWDDPARHVQLVRDLDAEYDGWAIAAWRTSLPVYLEADPGLRVAVWVKPGAVPGGARIVTSWEPVLLRIPATRTAAVAGQGIRDVLTASAPRIAHTGAKPRAWTRWVLDMLGYRDGDSVTDLFPGSGAVTLEIAQSVIDW